MALTDESNGNGFYMPVAPAYGGGYGNGGGFGGFGGDWSWIILLVLLCGGGWGGFGGGFYRGGNYEGGGSYARGRGRNARRDSMGRYSSERGYSRDPQEMADRLRDLMEDAPNENVRRDIERLMHTVEQM